MSSLQSMRIPVEPPPSSCSFPPAETADFKGRVFIGGNLEPGTVLAGYRAGLFPMPQWFGSLTWWSPDPRGILPLDTLHVSRKLQRTQRRFVIKVNSAFESVIDACAAPRQRIGGWITTEVRDAFVHLHELGWAHSVEAWSVATDEKPSELVGGLYGVAIGGFFSGESMFHHTRDASKAALVGLVELLRDDGRGGEGRLLDVQWLTPHLASLGAVEVRRTEYLVRLEQALTLPLPTGFFSANRGM